MHLVLDRLPQPRIVIDFELRNRPKQKFWLLLQAPEPELRINHPGYDEDLVISTDWRTLTLVHLGRLPLANAEREGAMAGRWFACARARHFELGRSVQPLCDNTAGQHGERLGKSRVRAIAIVWERCYLGHVKDFLIVATGGAGGDLQPLVAAALAVRERGHRISFIGDRSVGRALSDLEVEVQVVPSEHDLGPRLAGTIRDAMAATGGDIVAAGPIVEQRMAQWAEEVAEPIKRVITERRPDAVVTSLFGVEVVQRAGPRCPWAVINSTFYLGPNPVRPFEQDIGVRAIPLLSRYARLVSAATMVLHATDRVFDFGFDRLPAGHHYVGPLGIWEPPMDAPSYLDEPGDPWVLVSISSQIQDDVPLAQAAVHVLADRPIRVVVTLGSDHKPEEITEIPANAHIEQTVPHSAVLQRCQLLVSHAGHGSVMKALWHGRPMVLMPWGRDQPGVAARAQALGVAEVVQRGGNAEAALADAISRTLFNSDMQKAAAAHAERLRRTDPAALAASLLESLV
ncbi:MAG: glycosyltransferase [Chloroflexi bacterium]|nr:glycosyltransferase [Chloroflexota bacterium]